MEIQIISDNNNHKTEIIIGLNIGDEVKCIKSLKGIGGDFIPFPTDLLIKGKIYKVKKLSRWSFYGEIPWIIDEDGNSTWIDVEHFKI